MINRPSLREELKSKTETLCQILLKGKSVEIKRSTDGSVKIYEIDKRKR